MAIAWNDLMSTGVAEIDAQHKELIHMINSLGETMRSGKGKEEIQKMLTFAGEYAQKHFECEERYFDQYQCPAALQNKAGHEQFVKRFQELMQEFHEQGSSFVLVMRIYNEFSNWLVQHILGVDTKLRDSAKQQLIRS